MTPANTTEALPAAATAPVSSKFHQDEWANFITHGLGFLLSIAAAISLVRLAVDVGNASYLLGCVIFSSTMVSVYAASTLSHAFYATRPRRLFRTLDQAIIYLFIAGTYTPLSLVYLHGPGWTLLLVAMWGIGIVGFLSKVVLAHRIEQISTVLYVAQGWLPATAVIPIKQHIPSVVLWWMLAGGLCYTIGVVFLRMDQRVRFFHAVWHILVISGSACHWYAIRLYGLGVG